MYSNFNTVSGITVSCNTKICDIVRKYNLQKGVIENPDDKKWIQQSNIEQELTSELTEQSEKQLNGIFNFQKRYLSFTNPDYKLVSKYYLSDIVSSIDKETLILKPEMIDIITQDFIKENFTTERYNGKQEQQYEGFKLGTTLVLSSDLFYCNAVYIGFGLYLTSNSENIYSISTLKYLIESPTNVNIQKNDGDIEYTIDNVKLFYSKIHQKLKDTEYDTPQGRISLLLNRVYNNFEYTPTFKFIFNYVFNMNQYEDLLIEVKMCILENPSVTYSDDKFIIDYEEFPSFDMFNNFYNLKIEEIFNSTKLMSYINTNETVNQSSATLADNPVLQKSCLDAIKQSIGVKNQGFLKDIAETNVFNAIKSVVFKSIGNIVVDKVIAILQKLQNLFIDIKKEIFTRVIKLAKFINIPRVTRFITDTMIYGLNKIQEYSENIFGKENIKKLEYTTDLQFDNIKSTCKSVIEIADGITSLAFKNPITILESAIELNRNLTFAQKDEINKYFPVKILENLPNISDSKFGKFTLTSLKSIIAFKSNSYASIGINTLMELDTAITSCETQKLARAINQDNIKSQLYLNETEFKKYINSTEYQGYLNNICSMLRSTGLQNTWMQQRSKIPYVEYLLGPNLKIESSSVKTDYYYNPDISYWVNDLECNESASRIIETGQCTIGNRYTKVDIENSIITKQYYYTDLNGIKHRNQIIQKNGLISFLTEHLNKDFPLDLQTYNIEPFPNYMKDIFNSYDLLLISKNLLTIEKITAQRPMSTIEKPPIKTLIKLNLDTAAYSFYINYIIGICAEEQMISKEEFSPRIYDTRNIYTETEEDLKKVYMIINKFTQWLHKSKNLSIDHMSFIYVYCANIIAILYTIDKTKAFDNDMYEHIYNGIHKYKTQKDEMFKSLKGRIKNAISKLIYNDNSELRDYFIRNKHNTDKIIIWIIDNFQLCFKNNSEYIKKSIITNIFKFINTQKLATNANNAKLSELSKSFSGIVFNDILHKKYNDIQHKQYDMLKNLVKIFKQKAYGLNENYKDDFIIKELIFNGTYLNLIPYHIQNEHKDLLLSKINRWNNMIQSYNPSLSPVLFNFSNKNIWFYPKILQDISHRSLINTDGTCINIVIVSEASESDKTLIETFIDIIANFIYNKVNTDFKDKTVTDEIKSDVIVEIQNEIDKYIKVHPNQKTFIFLRNHIPKLITLLLTFSTISISVIKSNITPLIIGFNLLSSSFSKGSKIIESIKTRWNSFWNNESTDFESFKKTDIGKKFLKTLGEQTMNSEVAVEKYLSRKFTEALEKNLADTKNKSKGKINNAIFIENVRNDLSTSIPDELLVGISDNDFNSYLDLFNKNIHKLCSSVISYFLNVNIPNYLLEELKHIEINKTILPLELQKYNSIQELNYLIDVYNSLHESKKIIKKDLYDNSKISVFKQKYETYLTSINISKPEDFPDFFKNILDFDKDNFHLINYPEKSFRIKDINIISEGSSCIFSRDLRTKLKLDYNFLKQNDIKLTMFDNPNYSINTEDLVKSIYFSGHKTFYSTHGVSFGSLGSYQFIQDIQPNTVLLDNSGHIKVFTSKQKTIPNELISIRSDKSNVNNFFKGLWEIYSLTQDRFDFFKRVYFNVYSREGITKQQEPVSTDIIKFTRRLSKYIRYFTPMLKDYNALKNRIRFENKPIEFIETGKKEDLYSLRYPQEVESIDIKTIEEALEFLAQYSESNTKNSNINLNCNIDTFEDNNNQIILNIMNKFYCMNTYYTTVSKINIEQLITTLSFTTRKEVNNFVIKYFRQELYNSIINNIIIDDIPSILKKQSSNLTNLDDIKEYNSAKALNKYLMTKNDTIENFSEVKDALLQYAYGDYVLREYLNYLKVKNNKKYLQFIAKGDNIENIISNFDQIVYSDYNKLKQNNTLMFKNYTFDMKLHYALYHQNYAYFYSKAILLIMPDIVETKIFESFNKKHTIFNTNIFNILLYWNLNKILKINDSRITLHGNTSEDILLSFTKTTETLLPSGKLVKIIKLNEDAINDTSKICKENLKKYDYLIQKKLSTEEIINIISKLPKPNHNIKYSLPIPAPARYA